MIYLYSGTPGSGKSLHAASNIWYGLKYSGCAYVCNFPINMDKFSPKQRERFLYVDNSELTPELLYQFSTDYFKKHPARSIKEAEGKLRLYIDEAQILFNAREWQKSYAQGWTKFFQIHRHLGYDIYLMSQFDRMLDRQIRSLIEYEYVHRKVANIGVGGKVFSLIAGGGLFYCVKIWKPQRERVGGEFFKYKGRFDKLYDTHALFSENGMEATVTVRSGPGAPDRAVADASQPEEPESREAESSILDYSNT